MPPLDELMKICASSSPTGSRSRKVAVVVQHAAGRLDPVVHEDGLHLRDGRAFDAEVGVAPVVGVLRVAGPFGRDADAAGETDRAVDDQELAVRAVVEPAEPGPARLVVALDLDAGRLHLGDDALVHPLGADPVQHHVHLDAGARAFRQRVGERAADVARPVDVRLEVDGLRRTPDRLEHRGEDAVAVDEDAAAVAADDRRSEQHAHAVEEAFVADAEQVLDPMLDELLAGVQVEDEQHDDQRRHDRQDDGDHRDRLTASARRRRTARRARCPDLRRA